MTKIFRIFGCRSRLDEQGSFVGPVFFDKKTAEKFRDWLNANEPAFQESGCWLDEEPTEFDSTDSLEEAIAAYKAAS